MSILTRLLNLVGQPSPLVISQMRRRDLALVQAIEMQVYPKPWSTNVFSSELELMKVGQRSYITAWAANELVGYAGMMFTMDEAHITNIAVDPARQRDGIGRRLLAELAWEARNRACVALTLEVRISNVPAQALYAQFGFEAAGIRKNYYENVEDAIVMWCHDIEKPEFARRLQALCPEFGA